VIPAELILYATPAGPLAAALEEVFDRIRGHGATTAQGYPPHCTLTGFFHRDRSEIPRIVAEIDAASATVERPVGGVDIIGLHHRPDWVGLELASDWLHRLTARFVELHAVGRTDDPLRPKDWLHLSIGYGVDDLRAAVDATDDLDIALACAWEVGLWQRHPDGAWSRPGR
jgi:ubiquitin-associated SH3 domain-containing protein